jgi:hypothetical protein
MHVVIAWWDGTRSAGSPAKNPSGRPEAPGAPKLAAKTFGCAPSHRWSFEWHEFLQQPKPDGTPELAQELSLLLHV